MLRMVNPKLLSYLQTEISKYYEGNDAAHSMNHINEVLERAIKIKESAATFITMNKVYVLAYFHDVGLRESHARHHIISADILRKDQFIKQFFSANEIEELAQAIEDHRSSGESEPRSVFGKFIADADRDIDPAAIIRRFKQVVEAEVFIWKQASGRHCSAAWVKMMNNETANITDADIKAEVYYRFENKYGENGRGRRIWFELPDQVNGVASIARVAENYRKFENIYATL